MTAPDHQGYLVNEIYKNKLTRQLEQIQACHLLTFDLSRWASQQEDSVFKAPDGLESEALAAEHPARLVGLLPRVQL